jgi:hypothetical protein
VTPKEKFPSRQRLSTASSSRKDPAPHACGCRGWHTEWRTQGWETLSVAQRRGLSDRLGLCWLTRNERTPRGITSRRGCESVTVTCKSSHPRTHCFKKTKKQKQRSTPFNEHTLSQQHGLFYRLPGSTAPVHNHARSQQHVDLYYRLPGTMTLSSTTRQR